MASSLNFLSFKNACTCEKASIETGSICLRLRRCVEGIIFLSLENGSYSHSKNLTGDISKVQVFFFSFKNNDLFHLLNKPGTE